MSKTLRSQPDPLARDVDRLLRGLANFGAHPDDEHQPRERTPTPVPRRSASPVARPRSAEVPTRRDHIALWARALLGIVLGGTMTQWPYHYDCGLPLLEYLGAVAMVIVAGAWVAVASWRLRNPPAHILALLLILWGIALAAGQILPRVGYAAQRLTWRC
jgi:hypothetical protein